MASIPVAPPPPPPPKRSGGDVNSSPPPPPPPPPKRPGGNINSSPPPPPPPPPAHQQATNTGTQDTKSPEAPTSAKQPASSDDLASLDALIDTAVDDSPSELVTSSVSTTSPSAEVDESEVPATCDRPVSAEESATVSRPPPTQPSNDDLPKEPPARSSTPQKDEGVLSTSSMASSPRRPRRAGTGMPEKTRVSDLDFEIDDDIGPSARDEFEEEFLNRNAGDREAQIISDVLERVDFRQLSDDEEILSDDAADPSRLDPTARRFSDRPKQPKSRKRDANVQAVHLDRIRQSTVRSNWRRIPSEVGCEGCEGCDRLCGENRKLRRQLDELEFELASGVLHNPPDGFDPADVMRPIPAIPQIPTMSKKKQGWTNKLRNATALSVSSSKPGERTRLKSEVQALNVTTEYLWRKLNKAENELRNYRLKDLRNRMKMSAGHQQTGTDHDGARPRDRHLDLVGTSDWDWE